MIGRSVVHPDGIGYLMDLAADINQPWFKMICDLACGGISVLDASAQNSLVSLYIGNESYTGIKSSPLPPPLVTTGSGTDFLEQLSGFDNFKRLGNELQISFNKQITLIFGATGSGKSSLCESLKLLTTSEVPNRPIENVLTTGLVTPTFHYKFRSDSIPQIWTPSVGYGSRATTVKYFDSAIAIKNTKDTVEPSRIILIAPFRLYVFEHAKELTIQLREILHKVLQKSTIELREALERTRNEFTEFKQFPLGLIEENSIHMLPKEIERGSQFQEEELLLDKQTVIAALEKATSEEGLRLLRAEHHELETLLTSIDGLLTSATSLWAIDPARKSITLIEKQNEQEALAKVLIPKGVTLDGLITLLRAATSFSAMEHAEESDCPLCKRPLGPEEVHLFKRYRDLLNGELEKEINDIRATIAVARRYASYIQQYDRRAWSNLTTVHTDIVTLAMVTSDLIVANCDLSKEPAEEARAALESLKSCTSEWRKLLEVKGNAIGIASQGRNELVKQIALLRSEIDPLKYSLLIKQSLTNLKHAQTLAQVVSFWNSAIPTFTQILKKITDKAKEAYEELVVADFEARLDSEYRILTEKPMAAFGVTLYRRGSGATVTVWPNIGGKDIEGVLSEGEQRVHALALFYAELETCSQSVVVFDDPVSSFDYNYIANYCGRLRDVALKYPTRQIVILTHNWEFFVQLQNTLNKAGLTARLSVQVLENCTVVAAYSEKVDDLRRDIELMLSSAGEPSRPKKEEVAGKMRRLIEAVVNTHVFNNQRHQYKQKSQAVTEFDKFTKIVPLLPAEAATLGDLYSKLSITEHDDPRAAYVNTDKATFQTRYDKIRAIETALISRK